MVCSTSVKLCELVDLVYWYIPLLSTRPQWKRRTRDFRKSEGGRLRAIVQWKCVNPLGPRSGYIRVRYMTISGYIRALYKPDTLY